MEPFAGQGTTTVNLNLTLNLQGQVLSIYEVANQAAAVIVPQVEAIVTT